jgi:hypothetical protein
MMNLFKNKFVKIGLVGLLVVGAWFVMATGVKVAVNYSKQTAPRSTASLFMNDLIKGYSPAAFAQTTKGFQAKNNQQQFMKDVAGLEAKNISYTTTKVIMGKKGAVILGKISSNKDNKKFVNTAVRLEKVNDKWQVNTAAVL